VIFADSEQILAVRIAAAVILAKSSSLDFDTVDPASGSLDSSFFFIAISHNDSAILSGTISLALITISPRSSTIWS
jgi:hypothetical protein